MQKPKSINNPLKPINNKIQLHKNDSYLIINVIIAGIIVAILIYSGIFSATGIPHPIKSQTIEPTVSTGLSRAFSEIVRLNFAEAIMFNPYSIPIFLFFIFQFFLRFLMSLLLITSPISKNLLLFADILVTVLLFLWSFCHFISDQF